MATGAGGMNTPETRTSISFTKAVDQMGVEKMQRITQTETYLMPCRTDSSAIDAAMGDDFSLTIAISSPASPRQFQVTATPSQAELQGFVRSTADERMALYSSFIPSPDRAWSGNVQRRQYESTQDPAPAVFFYE